MSPKASTNNIGLGRRSNGGEGNTHRKHDKSSATTSTPVASSAQLYKLPVLSFIIFVALALFYLNLIRSEDRLQDRVAEANLEADILPHFEFSDDSTREWPGGGTELLGIAPKPGVDVAMAGRSFALLRDVVVSSAQKLRSLAESLPKKSFGEHADEVDGLPAFEAYLLLGAKPKAGLDELTSVLQKILSDVLVPYVRQRYSCPDCVACTAFLRRYSPGERRLNPNHFDMEAFSTIVVALSDSREHGGGLYVQPLPSVESRRLLNMNIGDVLVHKYDLNHGVAVTSGTRYSMVVWVASDMKACTDGLSPWYASDAAKGDADAQWNLGHLHKRGERGYALDKDLATNWYERSALQGHPGAMNNFGLMLEESRDNGTHVADAWFQRSAEEGDVNGQMNFARRSEEQGNSTRALWWYTKAALQGSPAAMVSVGRLLEEVDKLRLSMSSILSEQNVRRANIQHDIHLPETWYRSAVELGYGPAFNAMGRLDEAHGKPEIAVEWRRRGAASGDTECMMGLAKHYLQGSGVAASLPEARSWLERASAAGASEASEMLSLLSGVQEL